MADIKISELSIGDWVEIDGRPKRISSVLETPMGGLVRCQGQSITAFVEHIKPIPLTPEILEKNGFVRGEYSEIRVYNEWEIGEWSDPPYASVRLDIDRQVIRVINRGRDMFIAEKEIYVHQLQHALRLAGVGKEIEL